MLFPGALRQGKPARRIRRASNSQSGGRDQIGRPYRINGKLYRPYAKPDGFTQTGAASWYGAAFHGRKTANGEVL